MIQEKIVNPTEDVLLDRVLANGPPLAFGQGNWRSYDGGIWKNTENDTVLKRVWTVVVAAKDEGIKPTARLMQSVATATRVTVSIPNEFWDADDNILVCRNGVLDIGKGRLMEHSPEYHATSGVPYDYDKRAKAPTWERFISEAFASDVAAFLQEFAGLALTTDQSQEVAVWLYSPPSGGKSTFLAGIKAMMGERAGELGLRELSRSRFSLATLPGKTLVTATEQPAGFMDCTDLLNKIISGDPLQVERKYHDPIDITPRAKIMWAMNELPAVYEADNGLFRRIAPVRLEAIPRERRDPNIRRAIESEGAGVLNWALDGLARYKERGHLVIPESVLRDRGEFQRVNDVPRQFLESEWCEYDPSRKDELRTGSRDLYNWYVDYCRENGHGRRPENRIREDWERLGLERIEPGGRKVWLGVETRRPGNVAG
jgi:putative DNA primase/helicase